ncbi:hypothetical protein M0805_003617 [Coniferiporia weirii]|nr:hypothetical protein M0805_003617 [Coniferiporia weirii]
MHSTIVIPIPTREHAPSFNVHPPKRQLSARRGSVSAPDPHATRTTPPPRSALSRLTVVRVPPSNEVCGEQTVNGRKHQSRQATGRSSPGPGSPSRMTFAPVSFSHPSPTLPARGLPSSRPSSPSRMSFASASFANPGRPQSPTPGDHHKRNSSVASTASSTSSYQQRLSPGQIYDLAKVSSSPVMMGANHASPVSFTQLSGDVYLPFVDRPSEVLALISNGGNAKLMALFSQALARAAENHPRSSADLASCPESWSFADLKHWLSQVTRGEVNDLLWVRSLQSAILPRGEVLWERMKGMLGVPPELDANYPHLPAGARADCMLNIDEIHPAPFSPAVQLDNISELAEGGADPVCTIDAIVGLRMSTSLAFPPPRPQSPSPSYSDQTSPPPLLRTNSQGSVPTRSSPLVPKPHNAPSLAQSQSMGTLHVRAEKGISHSRESACPMFPASFDKLRVPPTLLSVN